VRRRNARGDACSPVLAKPLFINKVTRVARNFPLLDRHVDGNGATPAISSVFSARSAHVGRDVRTGEDRRSHHAARFVGRRRALSHSGKRLLWQPHRGQRGKS
jgi:hypothetical protein